MGRMASSDTDEKKGCGMDSAMPALLGFVVGLGVLGTVFYHYVRG